MDVLLFFAAVAAMVLVWRLVVRRLRQTGKVWVIRNLAGSAAGVLALFFVVALALEVGLITSPDKPVAGD